MEFSDIFCKEEYFWVDCFSLNQFIAEKYGIDSFECHLEAGNGSDHRHNARKEDDGMTYIEQGYCTIDEVRFVLNQLCFDGHIEEGTYNVSVSW